MMELSIDPSLQSRFPGLAALITTIKGVTVQEHADGIAEFRRQVVAEIKSKYVLDQLKDDPLFRSYRDFFWRAGIDPTKTRPASEALIRRILADKPIPSINSLVDSYNLASIKTGIPLAAFDQDKLQGALVMRSSGAGETFLGIGMAAPMNLQGGEIVVSDEAKLIAVYPHRDADSSKITEQSRNVLLMTCGCPGVPRTRLEASEREAVQIVTRFCGGAV